MKTITQLLLLALVICSGAYSQEKLDMEAISKIRRQGLENSKVMDIAFQLTDVAGPRLTNSPGYFPGRKLGSQPTGKMGAYRCPA